MPPSHAALTDTVFKFVMGLGLAGGAVWKFCSISGSDHYDHKMLGSGEHAPEKAKEADRLIRRHSASTNVHSKELHPEAAASKAAL